MRYQIIYPDTAQWDAFVRGHARGHLLQLSAWGELKAAYGWRPLRVALGDETGAIRAGGQMLLRRLPLRLGMLAYMPYAPLVDWADTAQVHAVLDAVDHAARQRRAAFLKAEPGHGVQADWLRAAGFRASPQTVQPPRTIVIDLDSEDAVMKRMNQMTRRNIRKSHAAEISIREGSRADVDSFAAMLDETGRRQDFGVHVASYYHKAYELFVPTGDAVLLIGSFGGQDMAGVFVFRLGEQAWYLYGASRHDPHKRMASFGVQWAGIQWAMRQGCTTYDMYGIPDEDESRLEALFETRNDGLWGVYRFKRGWGGRVVRTVGAWDRVYNRAVYWLYQLMLKRRSAQDG